MASIRNEPGNNQNPNIEDQALLLLWLKITADRYFAHGDFRSAIEMYQHAELLFTEERDHLPLREARPFLPSPGLTFCLAMKARKEGNGLQELGSCQENL